jgi:CDP-glycerol glycerophosphotransferase
MAPLLSFVVAGDAPDALAGPELADAEVVRAEPDAALEQATGEYVWFLEAGAAPAPGAIAAVAERLRAEAPDLLLVDRGAHRALLKRVAGDGVVTLEERPGLAATAARLGDKVFRREHLRELGLRFSPGSRGELAVTWPALLAAGRVVAVPDARVTVPAPAPGPADEIAPAFARVFAFLDAHPEVPAARRRLVLGAMLQHELSRLRRLPAGEHAAAFAALSESWRRHRRGDEIVRGGRTARLETRLVARGAHGAFAALETALRGRRVVRRVRRRARRYAVAAKRRRLAQMYRRRLRAPVDPDLAVFAAYWYRGCSCNPRAIYEKALELVPGLRAVWVVNKGAVGSMPAGVDYVVANTPEYFDALARARVFVNNVNFPNHFVKRPGTVMVQTHHGTPLKAMGLDLERSPIVSRKMDFAALRTRISRWDYSVSSNRFSTEIWERVYPGDYETLEVGYPRNDVLVNATPDDVRRAREALDIAPGQVAVLYAPTHREFRSSYAPVLDVAAVADALGPDHVLLVRAHYFYRPDRALAALHDEGRIRDVAGHPSVEELCLAADVLLTDYSSIMFDYAVLDRPIVIHAPDWEAYKTLRGVYFDLMTEHPGVVTRTAPEVVDALRTTAWSQDAARARAAFRARFCALEDGRAAERVVRRVWLGEREVTAPRPAMLSG